MTTAFERFIELNSSPLPQPPKKKKGNWKSKRQGMERKEEEKGGLKGKGSSEMVVPFLGEEKPQ